MCKRTSMCKENIVQIYIAGSAHQRILCALRAALESSGVVASDLEFAARKLFSAQASHTTRKCFDAPPIEFASKMWKLLSSFFVEGQNLEIVLETMGNCWRRQSKFFKEGEKYIKVFLSRQIDLNFFSFFKCFDCYWKSFNNLEVVGGNIVDNPPVATSIVLVLR